MRASNQFADATSGVVYIHASPAALCPHVEWALSDALNCRANLKWSSQPASDGQLRATSEWIGPVGTASSLAGILRAWQMLRFEVTENPSDGVDGERFSHVPGLGLWRGTTSANGDVVLGEMRLRAIMNGHGGDIHAEIEHALGTAWDDALEPFRTGGAGAEVTWLSRSAV